MVWSSSAIDLEYLMDRVKGFVDILVLAAGYQSSGRPAVWDVDNMKKALRFGLFFEEVLSQLLNSEHYEDSVKEFDTALSGMTSMPYFPKVIAECYWHYWSTDLFSCFSQGLTHLSSATLSQAKVLVLQHLLQTRPLDVWHFSALFAAVLEMDLEEEKGTDNFDSTAYMERLVSRMDTVTLVSSDKRNIIKPKSSSEAIGLSSPDGKRNNLCKSNMLYKESKSNIGVDNSCFLIQELLKRQEFKSCISSLETMLDYTSNLVRSEVMVVPERGPFASVGKMLLDASPSDHLSRKKKTMTDVFLWCKWKSQCLSYLLDKRTIRILAGAKLIFSAPKTQWSQVFEQLIISTGQDNSDLLEIMEASFLGIISRRWNALIQRFISHSCFCLPTNSLYTDLFNLVKENPLPIHSKMEELNTMENDILDYITALLNTQPDKIWLLPPVLAAAAIPSWSTLFRIYLSQIEKRYGESPNSRCCSCVEDGKEHKDCEVAERIRSLYVFHILDSGLKIINSPALS